MKTVKRMDLIDSSKFNFKRVKDDLAHVMVKSGGWKYCPKSEWKNEVRDHDRSDGKNENG